MITGITFVSHELRSGKIELNSLNPSDPMVPESYQQNETIKSLQLPVLSSFYFGNKLKIGFSFGPAYNYWYRIDYRGYGYWPNETKEYLNTTKLNPGIHFISAIAGVGGEYNFRNLSVRMEPSFTCQLFCINDETMNNNRLWSVGLALSGYYKF
jgi:hypothetical protein